MQEKVNQRTAIRAKISQFENKELASKVIAQKVLSHKKYQQAKNIFVYLNNNMEVDTTAIIQDAFSQGKRVFVPITNDIMYFSEIYIDTIYEIGKFNIRQPKHAIATDIVADLIIVPLMGFDSEQNRLGKGKGYYDRFLNGNNACKMALAFSVQELKEIATTKNDIKMDIIITEEGTIENYQR